MCIMTGVRGFTKQDSKLDNKDGLYNSQELWTGANVLVLLGLVVP